MSKPFDELTKAIGKSVLVKLKSGVSVRGYLASFDVHLNIILENATELDAEGTEQKEKHSKLLLRGDNILYISL